MYRSAQVRNLPIFRLFFELPCEVRCGGAGLKNGPQRNEKMGSETRLFLPVLPVQTDYRSE
mgnify:CR=1 FL=1